MNRRLSPRPTDSPVGSTPSGRRITLAVACGVVFIFALGVRLLEWQDREIDIQGTGPLHLLDRMAQHYQHEARRMIDQGRILFSYPDDPGDAHPVLHPPGYSILLAGLYGSTEPSGPGAYRLLRFLQVICDAVASVLVVLTAAELLPIGVAAIAGGLVAFSPQLAFYSLWLTPEPLSSFMIVIAVYIMVRALARPVTGRTRTTAILMLGTMVGMSCWLRSINLFLGPFVCLVVCALVGRGKRLRSSIALLAPVAVLILPVAVRNWRAYHRFIPLSIGSGITLIEGIAEYDTQGRFDLPRIDDAAKAKDAEWYGRPEYGRSPWSPDGVERDRARLARGLSVVRSNPLWFLRVMFRRGCSMLRYNDDREEGWPADSAKAPVIEREPPPSHSADDTQAKQPVWQSTAQNLVSGASIRSSTDNASLARGGSELEIMGDESDFGDLFVSRPIAVHPLTDYAMKVRIKFAPGVAIRVTSSDRRVMLGSAFKSGSEQISDTGDTLRSTPPDSPYEEPEAVDIGFASGNRSEVRLVVSNNGKSYSRSIARLGAVEIFELGPTPHSWSRYVRPIARSFQRRLYTTSTMQVLSALGVLLLAMAGRGRALLMLLAVPLYYLCVQSALHTEYRYTLPIHYFLFVLAAVTLYFAVSVISLGALQLGKGYLDHHRKASKVS